MNWIGWILIAAGAFACGGSIFNWEWFFRSSKAQLWVKIFGRTGARIFYMAVGSALIWLGAYGVFFGWQWF